MKEAVQGRKLGKRICEVFGLDPQTVSSIRIDMNSADAARVHVELIRLDADGVVATFRDYELVEKEPE